MLAHILALTVGLLSFALYMSAFFFPEVYRKSDLTWSGIGLFYALVLWVCAGRITGGVLLGQTASVALLGWLGWQTINLRRELAPIALRTPLPNEAKTIGQAAQFKLGELKSRWQQTKLADQTNRLAGTIAGWTGSIAKPKKQPPPVGSRSRKSKQPVSPIVPAAISEPVVSDGVSEPIAAEPVVDAGSSESAIDEVAAVEPPVAPVRPARPSGLFGGLRRNTPKPKAVKAKAPQRPIPSPEPSPDLEEFENWDDEETIDSASTSEAVLEDGAVVESEVGAEEAAIEDVVVIIESEEMPIEKAEVKPNDPAIEGVVVVIEPDEPPSVAVIEVEVMEAAPPAEDVPEASIEPDVASVEVVSADDGASDFPPADGDEPAAPQA
ncbi:hypothetical protein H6F67_17205 [Microcoleus sp. FACHB-1515]|uniref:Ycf66 family protein n=1 Tax=Cyanophyceae TaxID=3028117 RepID=UPI00168381C2|nr:Ycf66 family protein [Microcoleus sp. FACHB-1515]MBD2091584.1 hypothetical protein [Microcoleus sp. FACHB-1515]